MSAPKPKKAPFAFFHCPNCAHQSRDAWVFTRRLSTYAWCESCCSYFLQRNSVLFGMLWGGIVAPLIILLVMEGPLAPWRQDFGVAALMVIAALVALPIVALTLPYCVKWTIRYDYIGRIPRRSPWG